MQQYHIILLYANNYDILVINSNNLLNSIEKRYRTLKQLARVSQRVCVVCMCVRGGGVGDGNAIKIDSSFFKCNFSCTVNLLIRITFCTKILNLANITQLQLEKQSFYHIWKVWKTRFPQLIHIA